MMENKKIKIFGEFREKEIIEDEKSQLKYIIIEYDILKSKWFKFSKTRKDMEFLKYYIQEKQLLINKLEK